MKTQPAMPTIEAQRLRSPSVVLEMIATLLGGVALGLWAAELMHAYAVVPLVNNVANDGPELLEPAAVEQLSF